MSRFGRVAVLYGGWSDEREVSLQSGAAVFAALQRQGVEAELIDVKTPADVLALGHAGFDRAFIALHGRGGEDGRTQAVLEFLGIPYTGSGVAASALAMDKLRSKQVWQSAGLPTPPYRILRSGDEAKAAAVELGLPLFVKPCREGSSVGLSKVQTAELMPAAFDAARAQDELVIAELGIAGGEYTAAIVNGQALPLIQIVPATEYYDYAAKYELDSTQYRVPEELGESRMRELQTLCLQAYQALGCRGWGRVDFMLDEKGEAWLLEANTSPGMTSHSLVPMAAAANGMNFDALVLAVLEPTLNASSEGSL